MTSQQHLQNNRVCSVARDASGEASANVLIASAPFVRMIDYSYKGNEIGKEIILSEFSEKWVYVFFRPWHGGELILLDEIYAPGAGGWLRSDRPGQCISPEDATYGDYPYTPGYYRLSRSDGQHLFLVAPLQMDAESAIEECRSYPENESIGIRSMLPLSQDGTPTGVDFTNLAFVMGRAAIGGATAAEIATGGAAAGVAAESATAGVALGTAGAVGMSGLAIAGLAVGAIVLVGVVVYLVYSASKEDDEKVLKEAKEKLEREKRIQEHNRVTLELLWLNGFITDDEYFSNLAAGTLPGIVFYPDRSHPSRFPASHRDLPLTMDESSSSFYVRGYAENDRMEPAEEEEEEEECVQPPRSNKASLEARKAFGALRDGYAERLGVCAGGQVHHAIELQVLTLFPDAFSEQELNSFCNMRGVPPEETGKRQLHNSMIRAYWDRHYLGLQVELCALRYKPGTFKYRQFARQYLIDCRDEIDFTVGQFFSEQRCTLNWERVEPAPYLGR